MRYLNLLLFLFLLSCTANSKDFPYLLLSLSGDGKLFSYTSKEDGKSFINIISIDGSIIRTLRDPNASLGDAYFGDEKLFHVVHHRAKKESAIRACDKYTFTCEDIYEADGFIRCVFEYGGKLAFFHSDYDYTPNIEIPYNRYSIYIFDSNYSEPIKLNGEHFIPDICPGKSENVIDFGAFSLSDLKRTNNKYPWITNEYKTATISGKDYDLFQQDIKINDSVSILYYNSKEKFMYVRRSAEGGFKYDLCRDFSECKYKNEKTNPVIVNNDVFYGIWDGIERKMNIHKWK